VVCHRQERLSAQDADSKQLATYRKVGKLAGTHFAIA
jgi:hypothetical protein